jgi:hypothetical protein
VFSVSALKLEALSTHLNWGLVSSSPAWSGKFLSQLIHRGCYLDHVFEPSVCSVSALKLEALSTHLNWGLVSSSPAWSGKFVSQLFHRGCFLDNVFEPSVCVL